MTYNTGLYITDKRGGNVVHSWDLGLMGTVTPEQREVLEAIITGRRLKKWRNTRNCDGVPLTYEQIRKLNPAPGLREMLDDLVAKGYLTVRHPRRWENGRRVDDTTRPMGYDIATGQLTFEITRLLTVDCIAPTIVPTDVAHIGVVVQG